jgi:hypothetical protein
MPEKVIHERYENYIKRFYNHIKTSLKNETLL